MYRLVLVALLVAVGCGDGRRAVYPASGKVLTARGEPAVGATVVFHPLAKLDDNAHKPAGVVGEDGVFRLSTYLTDDGAPAGDYAVTVEWRGKAKSLTEDAPDRLKGAYRDPGKSPFKRTIAAGSNDLEPIKLP